MWMPWQAVAQETDTAAYFVQQLDSRNGLSNSAINAIYQDGDHLLWAATWDGLNMYDGSSFHVYNYTKDHSFRSIGNNVVLQIGEDKRGQIWISTIEGVSRYDKQTGKFSNYFYERGQHSRISEQEYELVEDTAGQVFCLTRRDGLLRYDARLDSFVTGAAPAEGNRIVTAVFDADNRLWLLRSDGAMEVYGDGWRLLNRFSGIAALFNAAGKILFTGQDRRLFMPDAALHPQLLVQLPHALKAVTVYNDHYLFAWATQGLGVYDRRLKPASIFQHIEKQLAHMKITALAPGSEQILWCGTDGNGIVKIFPAARYFAKGPAINKPVRAFCEVDGQLWTGTKGNGIVSGGRAFTEELDNNSVFALCKGRDSLVYIGTDGKGLNIYDRRHRRFLRWQEIEGSSRLPFFASVYAILQDPDGSLWLGTSGYGLIHMRVERKGNTATIALFEQYTFNGTDTGPANDIIYALAEGPDHALWVGCRYGGLNLFDKGSKRFRLFKAFNYEGSLSHNDVLALYTDRQRRLWVGTSYGLNRMEENAVTAAQPQFEKFNTGNGLPNNTIHAITQDDNGLIWVSTNRGLARIDPATADISHFQEQDGLQSNEFSDGAVWKSPDGYLYFGGIYGYNYFQPSKIRGRNSSPGLLVTGLQIARRPVEEGLMVLRPGQSMPANYSVKRRENFFELQLKAISFLQAEKCEFAYFLEGYDKAWQYSGGYGRIAYGNVPPGSYTLMVKWSNGEGVWSSETPLLQLTVEQYFWLTWPAFLLYLLVLSIAGSIFWLYRKNKLEMRHQLEMEHLLRKKEEEVHQEQLGFFTNIAHELQTPLTLIVGAAERRDNFSLIHQQASRLTYLVQQLLEFRRAEAGFLKNHFTQLNISTLLENIAALFIPIARQKGLQYSVQVMPGIIGLMDKDKLEKIMFNLLSNACKHSPRDQQVTFRTALENGKLEISVYNGGAHIPEAQQEKIFSRFFAADTHPQEKFSSGIGLAFTRQLVQLLEGNISVANEKEGVIFHVQLPLTTTAEMPAEEDHAPSYLLQSVAADPLAQELPAGLPNKLSRIDSLDAGDRKSILLVEDEYAIRQMLRELLCSQYIIYEAGTGLEALDLIRRTMPDLIISDIMMPDMNGLELCDRVKNAPSSCHIPFIILSARGTMDQQTEGYEAGADAYIPKPFQSAHLLVRVRKLLEYRERVLALFQKDHPLGNIAETEMADADKQFLQDLVRYIEDQLDDVRLNAEQLEKHLHLSKMQLYRKLKALSDMTPGEFIRYVRLKQAAHLLVTTRLTVAEIFYRTGFNNQSYFFREFKKIYQCSPNEYREQQTTI